MTYYEDDELLRRRLLYIGGDSRSETAEIKQAGGAALEAIAERYKLRRRRYSEIEIYA